MAGFYFINQYFLAFLLVILDCFKSILALPDSPGTLNNRNIADIIQKYYKDGYAYKEILIMLSTCHGIYLTYEALKKRIQRLRLAQDLPVRRGPTLHTDQDIRRAITELLPELPTSAGYRNVTATLRQKGYHCRRDQVMKILHEVDFRGSQERRRRRLKRRNYTSYGVDFAWHVDG
jgi:hypothetical protein